MLKKKKKDMIRKEKKKGEAILIKAKAALNRQEVMRYREKKII